MSAKKAILKTIIGSACILNFAITFYINQGRLLAANQFFAVLIAALNLGLCLGFGVLMFLNKKPQISKHITTPLKLMAGLAAIFLFLLFGYGPVGDTAFNMYRLLNIALFFGIALYMFKKPLGNLLKRVWRFEL